MNKMKNEKSTRMMALMLIGLMVFSTVGVFANSNLIASNQGETIQIQNHLGMDNDNVLSDFLSVEILPSVKIAEMNDAREGIAFYKIVVTDNHEASSVSVQDTFKYVLNFESSSKNVVGRFIESDTIELGRTESKTVELEVSTKELGISGFVVRVQGEDVGSHSKGRVLFVKRLIKPTLSDRALFNGKGMAIQGDHKESVYLKLVSESDNKLFGKIRIGDEDFKIEGFVEGEKMKFEVFDIVSLSASAAEFKVASFEGTFEGYERSILIKGQLIGFEGEDWDLTLMPKTIGKITNAELGVRKKYSVDFQDSISVLDKASTDANDKVYFNLIKVKQKKFLWIFPSKKKLIELEVIRGNKVFTKRITENSKQRIEGYSVSVGNLSDEDNIEFNIEDLA